jgi:hypothetical protein
MVTVDLKCDQCAAIIDNYHTPVVTAGISVTSKKEIIDSLLRPYTAARLKYDEPRVFCCAECLGRFYLTNAK